MGSQTMNRSQSNAVFSANVVAIPAASARLMVFEPCHGWREAVMNRLEELVRLEFGWDGYRGVPVTLENATFALRMLEAVCGPNAEAPQIVPGASGDLQIEWHSLKGDNRAHQQNTAPFSFFENTGKMACQDQQRFAVDPEHVDFGFRFRVDE